jgi:hypothetical protein
MVQTRYADEDCLGILRQIESALAGRLGVLQPCLSSRVTA